MSANRTRTGAWPFSERAHRRLAVSKLYRNWLSARVIESKSATPLVRTTRLQRPKSGKPTNGRSCCSAEPPNTSRFLMYKWCSDVPNKKAIRLQPVEGQRALESVYTSDAPGNPVLTFVSGCASVAHAVSQARTSVRSGVVLGRFSGLAKSSAPGEIGKRAEQGDALVPSGLATETAGWGALAVDRLAGNRGHDQRVEGRHMSQQAVTGVEASGREPSCGCSGLREWYHGVPNSNCVDVRFA